MDKKIYDIKFASNKWMQTFEECYCKVTGAEHIGTSQVNGTTVRLMLTKEQCDSVIALFERKRDEIKEINH